MYSGPRLHALLSALIIGVGGERWDIPHHFPHYSVSSYSTTVVTPTTTYETYPIGNVTIISPTTVITTDTITNTIKYPTTILNTTTVTISVPETIKYPTTILNTTTVTVSVPETETTTVSVPETETITVTDTAVYPTLIPTTLVTTIVVPTTITPPVSYVTITPPVSYSTVVTTVATPEDECPTTCSLVASTVRLVFWPTSDNYTYPATYVEKELDYTFTSPSVYLLISTLYGTNSIGRAGPSGTNEVFPLHLDQVSTIVPGNQITRQLTLDDLYTNCPQSADPKVIATTIPDGHCDFSLLAPPPVKQWAYPCNACGRLGLFDPPYAIPALSGGIIETTITTTIPITTTSEITTTFESTTSPSSGPTSTIVTATGTITLTTQTTETEVTSSTGGAATSTGDTTTLTEVPTAIPTASASKLVGMCGAAWVLVTCVVILYL